MAFDEDGPQTPAAPTYGTEPWQCPWAASSTGDVSRDKLAVPGIMVASLSFQLVAVAQTHEVSMTELHKIVSQQAEYKT